VPHRLYPNRWKNSAGMGARLEQVAERRTDFWKILRQLMSRR
jgi:hypothetical protein